MKELTKASTVRPDLMSRAIGKMAGHLGPVVLMYHSIETGCDTPTWRWAVSLQRFREQIDYLASEGWLFRRLDELGSSQPAPRKQVVLTFDDAYADTLQAAEILTAGKHPASWFVVSSAMCGRSTWLDDGARPRATLLPSQLRDLLASGMEIGAHSKTHRRLAEINPAELKDETAQCKTDIEDGLGVRITSFSYPYGSYNPTVVTSVRKAGFERACTTENGSAFFGTGNFGIRRLAVTAEDTLAQFARKLFLLNDDPGIRGLVRSTRRMTRTALGLD